MKLINTLLFAGFTLLATAQTPMISHKSHSGNAISYFIDPSTNFGNPRIDYEFSPEQLKLYETRTFKPVNDSIIVLEVKDINQLVIRIDTLINQEKLTPFDFEFKYRDSILKNEVLENKKHREEKEKQFIKEQMEQQQKLNETIPAKKKKKSYLLFLFGITGGGMLILRVFRQNKSVQHSVS